MKNKILIGVTLFFALIFQCSIAQALEVVRQKNIASYIVFPMVKNDGTLISGAAGLDSEIDAFADGSAPDGFADCTNEATEIGSTGYYYLSLTNTELNIDYAVIQTKSSTTGALTQTNLVRTVIGDPLNFATNQSGRELDVTSTGAAGVDFGNIEGGLGAAEIDADAMGSSEFAQGAADKVWGTSARSLTVLDEDSTTLDINGTTIGTVTTVTNDVGITQTGADKAWGTAARTLTAIDEDNTTLDLNATAVGAAASVTGAVGSVTGNVGGTINGLTAIALQDFFDTDSTDVYGDAVAGSVVKEIADNAGGTSLTEEGIADEVWASAARTLTAIDEDSTTLDLNATTIGTVTNVTNDVGITQAAADKAWGTAARTLTAIDEDNTTLDLNATAIGSIAGNVSGNVTGTIGGLTAAALKDFFDTDSTAVFGDAVAGSVVKETADNAGGSSLTEEGIADEVWASITRTLTALDEDSTTIDINATPTGAAASVAGAVGSVTGNVGGNVTGSVGSLAAQAKADVNAEVDSALDTAIPGSPTSNSINERIKTMDDAYTATRAGYLDNLNGLNWTEVQEILLDTSTINWLDIEAIKVKTDTINWLDAQEILIDTAAINWLDIQEILTDTTAINWVDVQEILADTATVNWLDVEVIKGKLPAGNMLSDTVWTGTKAGFIDEAISGIDDNPWDNATRTLTAIDEDDTTLDINGTTIGTVTNVSDKTGYRLSGAGVDDIWDEDLTGHSTAGTAGKKLSDIPTSGTGDWTSGEKLLIKSALGLTDGDVDTGADLDGILQQIRKSRGGG